MARQPRVADVLAAVQELAAQFEAEAAERRRLWEVCLETPRRLTSVEFGLADLTARLSRIEAQVDALKRST